MYAGKWEWKCSSFVYYMPMRNCIKNFVLIGIIVLSLLLSCVEGFCAEEAVSRQDFEQARRAAQQLLKQDTRVRKLDEWLEAAKSLQSFLQDNPDTVETPKALFLLGQIFEIMGRERKSTESSARAVSYYEIVCRDFVGHYLADDALLRLGDLRRNVFRDEVGAKVAYFEIIDKYPGSDMVAEANRRVRGEARLPGIAVPVPRPVSVSRKKLAPVVVIDPGHGGEGDLGALGVDGDYEKDIVLNIAIYLDEMLRKRLFVDTVLTRARDQELALADRAKIANDKQADVFISIHANASVNKSASGIETYYLDNTADQSSLKLAERENSSFNPNADDLKFILSDLIQNAKLDDSITLAHRVQDSLVGRISRRYEGVNNLGVKKAPFYVLVGAHMPCVLTEVSFIDHAVEGKRLADRSYQRLIAEAIFLGIKAYFKDKSVK